MSDEELIQELRDMGEHPSRADLPMGRTLRDAADRIEALQADREKAAAQERAKIEADKAAHAATIEGILKSHEAFKQEVSDAVEHCRACSDPAAWTRIKFELERFIIAKPVDPLVEIVDKVALDLHITGASTFHTFRSDGFRNALREALAKRGLKIVETGQ